MLLNRLFSNLLYYSPEDSNTPAPAPDAGKTTIELLDEAPETLDLADVKDAGEETETDGKGEEKEGKEEEQTEEEDELKEIEEELERKKQTEEDEEVDINLPLRREILAKYPKLFKEFPGLEKAYYREREYTEVFSTVKNAKVAAEKAQTLDNLENQVIGRGDIAPILQAAKQDGQEAFNRIADNYLPALKHVDQQAYYHVLGNVIKDTIVTMVREARTLGEAGTPLQTAATILNQFVFGTQQFTPASRLSKAQRPEDMTREQEQVKQDQQRVMESFTSVKDDLQSRADNVLRATIEQNIDPRSSMTDYVKRNATRDAFETLEDLLSKDTRFHSLLDKLWEQAFQENFSKSSTDRIKSAYLSKAKTLLPSVIKRARNDALKGLGKRASQNEEQEQEQEEPTTRKSSPPSNKTGQSTPPPRGKFKSAKDIPKDMSTLDVLMRG